MAELKYNTVADGAGYLYRAAFAMAKGEKELAHSFMTTAEEKIGRTINIPHNKSNLYIAEKLLDEYQKTLQTQQTS